MKISSLALLFTLIACTAGRAQDTIVFENKFQFLVHVQQDSGQEVVYRKFQDEDSLIFTIHKRFISEIRYQDRAKVWEKATNEDFSNFGKPLEAWVTPSDSVGVFRGTLYGYNDSTLFLRKKVLFFDKKNDLNPDYIYVFPYKRIHLIEVKRQRQVGRYATWGAVGGLALGTISGLIFFKDSPACDPLQPDGPACDESLASPRTKFEKSLLLGVSTGAGGFIAGGTYGAIRIKIPIGGKRDVFNQSLPKLKRMAKTN